VADDQTIFLNKFLTFFNCHVQPLTNNLQFVEGCQCMVEMTNGNTLLVKWPDYASVSAWVSWNPTRVKVRAIWTISDNLSRCLLTLEFIWNICWSHKDMQ